MLKAPVLPGEPPRGAAAAAHETDLASPAPSSAGSAGDGLSDGDEDAGDDEGATGAPAAGLESKPGADQGRERMRNGRRAVGTAAGAARLSATRKAAILVLALEEPVATRLLRCLSDEEIGRISAEIADLGVIEREAVTAVCREFRDLERAQALVRQGGAERALELIRMWFPEERAERIRQVLEAQRQSQPFSFLAAVDSETLASCLQDEHPQTLAMVLAHMVPSQAAELLERLPPEIRREVLPRIAALEPASADAVRRVEEALRGQLAAARFDLLAEAGGVKAVADILRACGGHSSFLDDLRARRPDLAEEINRQLFVFDDVARLEDRALQGVLKGIDRRKLALALKDAREPTREKVLGNLSRRAVEAVSAELDSLGPVKLAEVEAARDEIVATILRLEERGEIFIAGRGREENRIVY